MIISSMYSGGVADSPVGRLGATWWSYQAWCDSFRSHTSTTRKPVSVGPLTWLTKPGILGRASSSPEARRPSTRPRSAPGTSEIMMTAMLFLLVPCWRARHHLIE
ncbi:hypothetical protein ASD90_00395 [Terrabacter sp. Root181]|nr:hypothetical protein ASD90_00395 [Terrabacter sp. Root181]